MQAKPKPGVTWHTCDNVLSSINHNNCNQGRTIMAKKTKSGKMPMGGKGGKC